MLELNTVESMKDGSSNSRDNREPLPKSQGNHNSNLAVSKYIIISDFIEKQTCLICETKWESTSKAVAHVASYHMDIISGYLAPS